MAQARETTDVARAAALERLEQAVHRRAPSSMPSRRQLDQVFARFARLVLEDPSDEAREASA